MKLGQVCESRVVTTAPDTLLPQAALDMRRMQVGAMVDVLSAKLREAASVVPRERQVEARNVVQLGQQRSRGAFPRDGEFLR
jgi:hypothetical protein